MIARPIVVAHGVETEVGPIRVRHSEGHALTIQWRDSEAFHEMFEAARDSLASGAHEGDCQTIAGEEGYNPYDGCALHVNAARTRAERLRSALAAYQSQWIGNRK